MLLCLVVLTTVQHLCTERYIAPVFATYTAFLLLLEHILKVFPVFKALNVLTPIYTFFTYTL